MSVAKSSLFFAFGTFLSRIAGLVRDRLVLSVFGASGLLDGFVIAFRIPNMLREMLAEGALGSSFTKVMSSLAATDEERARKLLVDSFFLMSLVSVVVCILGIILAPWIVELMTFKAHESAQGELLVTTATGLTRLLFPFLGFMILGAVAMGALHQQGRFFLTAISPLAFNAGYILGAIWLADLFAQYGPSWIETIFADRMVTGLAVGVLLGGLGQLLVQLWGIWQPLILAVKEWDGHFPWSPDLKKVLVLMGPMVLAASAGQVNMVVNTIFATSVGEGAVTWLYSAFRLLHFPIGIFGVAIGAAVLPALTRALAKSNGRIDELGSREIQNAMELVLWFMAPCFVLFQLNSLEVVRVLYEGGRFVFTDSLATSQALTAYSYVLFAYGLNKVMTSFYFAFERTTYALKVSIFGIAINLLANWLLVGRYGHVGLALAYSVTLTVSSVLLATGLRVYEIHFRWRKFLMSMSYMIGAGLLAALTQRLCQPLIAGLHWGPTAPIWLRAGVALLLNGTIILVSYVGLGLLHLRLSPAAALRVLRGRRRPKGERKAEKQHDERQSKAENDL